MNIIKKILIFLLLSLIPFGIGMIIYALTKDTLYLECIFVIFGLLEFLLMSVRSTLNTRSLYRKKSTKEDFIKSKDSIKYYLIQNTLLISGLINLALSLIVFFIFNQGS